jgi:asparagine synthase (glutamine-hydrolysing)
MCGFVGVINCGDRATLDRMVDAQTHRGPDDRGTWDGATSDGGWGGLGSRRLSIRDLSPAGHMPMSTPDGRLTIAYNGEIYNADELRRELEQVGCIFRSHSDTEVVLYLYQRKGPECVKALNGIFAFAIWDADRDQLFMARDHFGIKPFYYWHKGRQFACASELKSLLFLPETPREMSAVALHQYLSFLWVPDPLTIFDGVLKLPAGHCAVLKRGQLTISEYWDLKPPPAGHAFSHDEPALAQELRDRFVGTVRSQLVSDVPVGAFLSAGIDSSCIVAAMAQSTSEPVRTFTIVPTERYRKGSAYLADDAGVARRTAQRFGCQHTEIVVEPRVAELLPHLIWHMDEPVADPAILSCYLINREARKNVTVILAGNGGDELFAGYRKYVAHYLAQWYQRVPAPLRRGVVEPLVNRLPALRGTPLARSVHLAKKMARSGSMPPVDRFVQDSVYLSEERKQQLCETDWLARFNGIDPRFRHLEFLDRVRDADFLNQMLYLDTKLFLVSLNLTYNDKMSMANSMEARVPFLDWQLAEWVMWNIPPSLKLKGRETKYILRRAMEHLVPAEVFAQSKTGFGAPVDYWMAHDLREMVDDLLGEQRVRQRGLFNPDTIAMWIREQRAGKADWSMQLWQLLTLELWMQQFVDATPAQHAMTATN